tara:strand:+ start:14646 stop:14846 length:201 start_codon:yes stop_codon:yes gene_type:complete
MEYKADEIYVIKKKNFGYWFLSDRGYTLDLNFANRFTEAAATEIINRPNTDKTMHLYLEELQNPTV